MIAPADAEPESRRAGVELRHPISTVGEIQAESCEAFRAEARDERRQAAPSAKATETVHSDPGREELVDAAHRWVADAEIHLRHALAAKQRQRAGSNFSLPLRHSSSVHSADIGNRSLREIWVAALCRNGLEDDQYGAHAS